MKRALENGFTVYVHMKDNKLIGTALRPFGNRRGIQPIYLEEGNVDVIDCFSFPDLLKNGRTLQMYRGSYEGKISPYYIAQIGTIGGEGAYGENPCFYIEAEGAGSDFYEALLNLDEQCQKQTEVEKKELFKKAYRTYGQVTYK